MDEKTISELALLRSRDLAVPSPLQEKITDREALRSWLVKVIEDLLRRDFQQLINALYRIDVDENRAKEAFATEGQVAVKLADLIMEQEMRKVLTRKKYRKGVDGRSNG